MNEAASVRTHDSTTIYTREEGEDAMKFSFTEERLVTEWERWDVDAGSLEEACRKFERLRFEEDGEIVNGRRHDSFLTSVSDEAGNDYPVDLRARPHLQGGGRAVRRPRTRRSRLMLGLASVANRVVPGGARHREWGRDMGCLPGGDLISQGATHAHPHGPEPDQKRKKKLSERAERRHERPLGLVRKVSPAGVRTIWRRHFGARTGNIGRTTRPKCRADKPRPERRMS